MLLHVVSIQCIWIYIAIEQLYGSFREVTTVGPKHFDQKNPELGVPLILLRRPSTFCILGGGSGKVLALKEFNQNRIGVELTWRQIALVLDILE